MFFWSVSSKWIVPIWRELKRWCAKLFKAAKTDDQRKGPQLFGALFFSFDLTKRGSQAPSALSHAVFSTQILQKVSLERWCASHTPHGASARAWVPLSFSSTRTSLAQSTWKKRTTKDRFIYINVQGLQHDKLKFFTKSYFCISHLDFLWLMVSFLAIHRFDNEAGNGDLCNSFKSPEYLKWNKRRNHLKKEKFKLNVVQQNKLRKNITKISKIKGN